LSIIQEFLYYTQIPTFLFQWFSTTDNKIHTSFNNTTFFLRILHMDSKLYIPYWTYITTLYYLSINLFLFARTIYISIFTHTLNYYGDTPILLLSLFDRRFCFFISYFSFIPYNIFYIILKGHYYYSLLLYLARHFILEINHSNHTLTLLWCDFIFWISIYILFC